MIASVTQTEEDDKLNRGLKREQHNHKEGSGMVKFANHIYKHLFIAVEQRNSKGAGNQFHRDL